MPEPMPLQSHANTTSTSPFGINNLMRYSGPDYSQSISVSDANNMISSYLESVNYPNQDSALRSLTFDADTLRSYLKDTSIVTLKFLVAHTPAYTNASGTNGTYAGMNPNAITLVIAGVNNANQIVRNTQGGVYEHCQACPVNCATSEALIR